MPDPLVYTHLCGRAWNMIGGVEGVQILWHRSSFNHCNSTH